MIEHLKSPGDLKLIEEKELQHLCLEIRSYIEEVIKENGGHLASNLGAVELTVAEHRSFDSPTDRIIFDVGHQSYTHKLLTGRYEAFRSIRKFGGISGFPKTEESVHDAFNTGHSSTSISAAIGMATARDLMGEDYHIVVNIGDGALSGGMALEALNHLGHIGSRIIIVLNDNEMSISEPIGAIAQQLIKISSGSAYRNLKYRITEKLVKTEAGRILRRRLSRIKTIIKHVFSTKGSFFEHFGLTYLGPYDGHDIIGLEEAFKIAKRIDKPTLVHVITTKGKGNENAEDNPEKYHGIAPSGGKRMKNLTAFFGEHLVEMAKKDSRITAITAAMCTGTGLEQFRKEIPERFFDVSIAEQHGLTFAAGQAIRGLRPFIAIYATFMQRGVDQVIHDICMQNLPVTMILDRAGLVGEDGETHHGIFDISLFGSLPNLLFMEPKDGPELKEMMNLASIHDGPVMIRFPKAASLDDANPNIGEIQIGQMEILVEETKKDIAIVALGSEVELGMQVKTILSARGRSCTLINPRFISPISEDLIEYLNGFRQVITIENHVRIGGFGSLLQARLKGPSVLSFGLPNRFIEHGSIEELRNDVGLNLEGIIKCWEEESLG